MNDDGNAARPGRAIVPVVGLDRVPETSTPCSNGWERHQRRLDGIEPGVTDAAGVGPVELGESVLELELPEEPYVR